MTIVDVVKLLERLESIDATLNKIYYVLLVLFTITSVYFGYGLARKVVRK
ncbi:hypothetical protein M5X00_29400 [Paenibacillus alvei]|nr:hypothetical protein [Paenibacillus alvei]MCY9708128.1 hypothetical protein [Paenibacillus alvei]MCY9738222.1 hypothetical protein [Paenibacillus alvei]MCY9758336.1 hypothetical protein [Paenibacillus alvei]